MEDNTNWYDAYRKKMESTVMPEDRIAEAIEQNLVKNDKNRWGEIADMIKDWTVKDNYILGDYAQKLDEMADLFIRDGNPYKVKMAATIWKDLFETNNFKEILERRRAELN